MFRNNTICAASGLGDLGEAIYSISGMNPSLKGQDKKDDFLRPNAITTKII